MSFFKATRLYPKLSFKLLVKKHTPHLFKLVQGKKKKKKKKKKKEAEFDLEVERSNLLPSDRTQFQTTQAERINPGFSGGVPV